MRLDALTADLREGARLRPVEDEDVPALFRLVDGNRAHLRAWMAWLDGTRVEADVRTWADAERAKAAEGKAVQFVILEGELPAGVVGFNEIDWTHRQVEIGYWLAENRQGRGLMTRAVEALVRVAFDELDLHRVWLRVATDNARSQAIPQRLGFRHEGTLRDAEWLYDHFVDLDVLALLEPEWREAGERNTPRLRLRRT
jgi:ribosomal-protein-serine acetyltransferase